MPRKSNDNTKLKIINAAWELFYEQGFDDTTIDDIIELSSTSKGSFYHYFESKNELLGTLAFIFDTKYEELEPMLSDTTTAFEKLMFLNKELFLMIENKIPLDLLTRLYSSQLSIKGDKNLLDHDRKYYKLLRKIVMEGMENGDFAEGTTINEVIKAYALIERALISDWCLCNGEYSLSRYSESLLPILFEGFKAK